MLTYCIMVPYIMKTPGPWLCSESMLYEVHQKKKQPQKVFTLLIAIICSGKNVHFVKMWKKICTVCEKLSKSFSCHADNMDTHCLWLCCMHFHITCIRLLQSCLNLFCTFRMYIFNYTLLQLHFHRSTSRPDRTGAAGAE